MKSVNNLLIGLLALFSGAFIFNSFIQVKQMNALNAKQISLKKQLSKVENKPVDQKVIPITLKDSNDLKFKIKSSLDDLANRFNNSDKSDKLLDEFSLITQNAYTKSQAVPTIQIKDVLTVYQNKQDVLVKISYVLNNNQEEQVTFVGFTNLNGELTSIKFVRSVNS